MYTRKAYATRETPRRGRSDDQLEAREGQAGRPGVAERFVVPLKPGNAGGGKGPQFKTDAIRGEGPGHWETYQLRRVFRNCRRRYTRKRRQKPAIASTPFPFFRRNNSANASPGSSASLVKCTCNPTRSSSASAFEIATFSFGCFFCISLMN